MELVSLILLVAFAVISFFHLLGEFLFDLGKDKIILVRYLTKPLLVPLLLVFFISFYWSINILNVFFILALIFGFLGDIFLMIPDPEKKRLWLKVGLGAFLVGHIFYIVAFTLNISWVWWSLFLAFPFVIAAALIHPYLTKHTGDMTKAVTAYIIVICLMGISSTFLFLPGSWSFEYQVGGIILYFGAWLFAISDTFNGVGKFVKDFKFERVITMFIYISGQLLIIIGYILRMTGSL